MVSLIRASAAARLRSARSPASAARASRTCSAASLSPYRGSPGRLSADTWPPPSPNPITISAAMAKVPSFSNAIIGFRSLIDLAGCCRSPAASAIRRCRPGESPCGGGGGGAARDDASLRAVPTRGARPGSAGLRSSVANNACSNCSASLMLTPSPRVLLKKLPQALNRPVLQ